MVRLRIVRLGAVVLALSLAACERHPRVPAKAETAPPAGPPAPVSRFAGDLDALGTEPFWRLTLRDGDLTLARPDHPSIKAEASGAAIEPDRAIWHAAAHDGQRVTLALRLENCSDGMSDRAWPMSAELRWGSETLKGCAGAAKP